METVVNDTVFVIIGRQWKLWNRIDAVVMIVELLPSVFTKESDPNLCFCFVFVLFYR